MLHLLVVLLPTLLSAMRSRRVLVLENLALRQQLVTLAGRRHPDIRSADQAFWVLLRRSWRRWAETLAIVRPDAVVRWHRAGFRTYWNWLSRRGARSGRLPSSQLLAEPRDTFTSLVRVDSRGSRSSVLPAPGVSGIAVTHWDVRIAL